MKGRRSGFILMEVVLAMALFGLAGLGLVRALNLTAKAANNTRVELRMLSRLESALTEASKADVIEEDEFTSEPDAMGVAIKTEVLPIEDLENEEGQLLSNMWLIRCTAYWDRNGVEQEIVAETYRYSEIYRPR